MAARLAPDNVRRMHQSLHHVVADAPWSDESLLGRVRDYALAAMTKTSPIVAWIVDDTGLPKKGTHSVGVARQYCGQTGKQDNCQVAVSLSVATWNASLPIAYRLYLPEAWANDAERRQQARIPKDVLFQTKLEIALGQIRQALTDGIPQGTVLADPAYGNDTDFRQAVAGTGVELCVGRPEHDHRLAARHRAAFRAPGYSGRGRPANRLRRDAGACAAIGQATGAKRCRQRHGRPLPGEKARAIPCAPVSPRCASALRIATTSSTSRENRNGS